MSVKETVSQYDIMTKKKLKPLIVKIALPSIASMLVTNIYNMVDTAFVGSLGTSASGAVGIVFAFMSLIQAFGFMFGQGAGSIMARALGKKDYEKVTVVCSTGVFFSLGFGIIISIFSWVFMSPLVRILGSTETIAVYTEAYISYIILATPFMSVAFAMNQLLRYEGKSSLGMVGMMTGAVLNMIGDPIFMFVLDFGIDGAGISTAISQTISFIILSSFYIRGKTAGHISIRKVTFNPKEIMDISITGSPSLFRQGLASINTMVLNGLAAVYGDAAIAAMSIVSRIIHFIFSIALGIGHGFQPVSAFNYGAGKYSRVRKGYRFTVILAESVIGCAVVLLLINSGNLIAIFRNDPEVIVIGSRALRIQAVALLFLPFSMVSEMLFQSTGKKVTSILLSLLRGGLIFLPSIVILAKLRGLYGIEEAQAVAFIGTLIPAILFVVTYFRKLPKEDRVDLEVT
jgi:putative MATE family efflux protein